MSFITEDKQTLESAEANGCAWFVKRLSSTSCRVVLYNKAQVLSELRKVSSNDEMGAWRVLTGSLKRSIMGSVATASINNGGESSAALTRVTTSVAVEKYGPLLYELALYTMSPLWLTSDNIVKPKARGIWSKFLDRSDEFDNVSLLRFCDLGDLQRKFNTAIAPYGHRNVNVDTMNALGLSSHYEFSGTEHFFTPNKSKALSKIDAVEWMETLPTDRKQQISILYAYRPKKSLQMVLSQTGSKAKEVMSSRHDEIINTIVDKNLPFITKHNILTPKEAAEETLISAARDLFHDYYTD